MANQPGTTESSEVATREPSRGGLASARRRFAVAIRRRGAHHRRRRRMPSMSVLPTLCTLGNLVAGFAAIHYAARDPSVRLLWHDWTPLTLASALIFLGMLLDAVDGSLARLTRSNSPLGAQLDSLADVVTFGVAPAFITNRLVMNHLAGDQFIIGPEVDNIFGKIIWGASAVYVSCAALRLARFNVEMDNAEVNDHSLFRGLPSPGAAGTVASLVILHQHLLVKFFSDTDVPNTFIKASALGIPAIMLLCAFAMVSNIPYLHFTNRFVRGPRDFPYIVKTVVLLAFAIWLFKFTLAAAFTAYALSGPIRMLTRTRRKPAVKT